MTIAYHYPPELLALLVDVIPLLCRSKKDVIVFFRGAGVPDKITAPLQSRLRADRSSINKYEIARDVLEAINQRGDSALAARREVLKRVVEFEEFSTCWQNDQLKARGLVAQVREVVNVKDSFTRMRQERDQERAAEQERRQAERDAQAAKREQKTDVQSRLGSLFAMDDKPQIRGKLLESVLNDLFRAHDIMVREDFCRRDPDDGTVLEQIDGVVELEGSIHLVEMKWLKGQVGTGAFAQHLVRLFGRADASGIFITSTGFTEPVLKQAAEVLNQRTNFLVTLQELVLLLQRDDDLLPFLRRKRHAAIVDKNPFMEIFT